MSAERLAAALRRGIFALAAAGKLRVRELEDGRFKLAPPSGSALANCHVVFDPATTVWCDPETGEVLGTGWTKLCQRLGLDPEACCLAMAPGV